MMRSFRRYLASPVDGSGLALFRILFGGLMLWEVIHTAFINERIYDAFIISEFYFPYAFFPFVAPLSEGATYFVFILVGLGALGVMLGVFYRFFTILFFLSYTYIFLLDQTQYNNHYYLVCLLGLIFSVTSAQGCWSVDHWFDPSKPAGQIPRWHHELVRFQLFLVYFFGGVAKINADWLVRGQPVKLWLEFKEEMFGSWASVMTSEAMAYFICWSGCLFDLLVGFALVWRRTRVLGVLAVLFFHGINGWLFNIGFFPYLMVAATVMFFQPAWPREKLSWIAAKIGRGTDVEPNEAPAFPVRVRYRHPALLSWPVTAGLAVYASVQLILPLRHWWFPGPAGWTGEGENFAWRMKLNSKVAQSYRFLVTDPETAELKDFRSFGNLTPWQFYTMLIRPELLHHYSQSLARSLERRGVERPEIRAEIPVSYNGRSPQFIVRTNTNLAEVEYDFFSPSEWIEPLSTDLLENGVEAEPDEGSDAPVTLEPTPIPVDPYPPLVKQYCGSCHAIPDPSILDRTTWLNQTLPRMKFLLGLSPEVVAKHPEGTLLVDLDVVPSLPLISPDDFDSIVQFYASEAPETTTATVARVAIRKDLKQFTGDRKAFRISTPGTTLVKIDDGSDRIFVGDGNRRRLDVLSTELRHLTSLAIDNIPVSIAETTEGLYLTSIGKLFPSDDSQGMVSFMSKQGSGYGSRVTLLDGLARPTCTIIEDLNGDSQLDMAVCMFGNNVGRFSWYEQVTDRQYREHVLLDEPGALRCEVSDFNHDERPDLAVLVAQAQEAFWIFYNDPTEGFQGVRIFQKHPGFGHTSFELVDFDADGRLDLLTTNGHNGDYPAPAREYHGVRLYRNTGIDRFEEMLFFPLNGAYQAVARDFDEDGDLDIAAISYYPDYKNSPEESFVYLENQGDLRFEAFSFNLALAGRWMTMDAGDVDSDGDIDLVLGSNLRGPTTVPAGLMQRWQRSGPAVFVLKNTLR